VTRYIRDNLASELSLTSAAEAAMLSPTYLANLLKRETGQTFTALVTARRMARAKELLLTTTLPIGDVATRCGYEDEAYFSRRFRQSAGCTARAFRANGRGRLHTLQGC
jgi:AraC-like DNA-binding protein